MNYFSQIDLLKKLLFISKNYNEGYCKNYLIKRQHNAGLKKQ